MAANSNEVIVAGAGLAGLTAALNLARDGKDVLILDRFDRVGGMPEAHPAVDVTPLECGPLSKFTGIKLGEPQIRPCENWNCYIYDYKAPMDIKAVNLHCVERGISKTALDVQLYNLCLDAGVSFEFNRPLLTQGDYAMLPPDSIIATGLYVETFEALNIPYEKVFGYVGRGKTDNWPSCGVWFCDYTLDYAYYGSNNGVVFALYFAREPIKDSEFERFREMQLAGQEEMRCSVWDYHEGVAPTASRNNPRMFAGDKILAGTLSGMMDPFALFGVHGALVSGKIAAMAHQDKAEAYALFVKYTRHFRRNLFARKIFDATPVGYKKAFMGPQVKWMQEHADKLAFATNFFLKALPGYLEIPR
ncbi:MAG: hypothetical protein CVT63_01370 [Candidatus Anoxymicrobium japonicum]|uniref:Uncharacterized protein n=1 Tax=Candidatus Anoxymicrobium japonicum TaxID=2013648 RepID=A0A2N3G7N1_9ACTN|nr:MAG: hypothetical protein CVT63_01370 [Candidatus Anoxymicrobium japonicum]